MMKLSQQFDIFLKIPVVTLNLSNTEDFFVYVGVIKMIDSVVEKLSLRGYSGTLDMLKLQLSARLWNGNSKRFNIVQVYQTVQYSRFG